MLNILQTRYGDLDINGTVDTMDFATLAANFGSAIGNWLTSGTDGDGDVDFADCVRLTNNFD